MKKLAKILLLILCATLIIALLGACTTPPPEEDPPVVTPPDDPDGDGDPEDDGGNDGDTNEDEALTDEQKFWRSVISDVSAYSVIRSYDLDGNPRLMAQALRYSLQSVGGKNIKLYSDINVDKSPKEIIIGVTTRLGDSYTSKIDDTKMAADEYAIEYIGETAIVHYGGFEGLACAVRAIIGFICESEGKDANALYNTATNYVGINPGEITLTNIYKDGMIFQQNKPAVIKGFGTPGYVITATLHNSKDEKVAEASGLVDESGAWSVSLTGQAGSYEAYKVKFSTVGIQIHTLNDLVFGEVWITTGQSNMLYKLSKDKEYKSLTLGDKYIRVLSISKPKSDGGYPATPFNDNENPSVNWLTTSNFAASVNAVSYYYAAMLREELDMPIGIIQYSVGGVPIRSWLSEETIKSDEEIFEFYKSKNYYVPEDKWVSNDAARKNASAFYNTMTCLIEDLSIAGVLWYQGEEDVYNDAADEAAGIKSTYVRELELLYAQYAEAFGFEENKMPFIYTLLVPYLSSVPVYFGEFTANFATFAQGKDYISAISIYDQSPYYDSTNTADHPNSKRLAGERSAQAAMAICYGATAPKSSPYPVSFTKENGALIITFANVADGLMIHSPLGDTAEIRGFTVCGADGVYFMAKAEIISATQLKVYSPYVSDPVGATYAYEINQRNCNLGCKLGSEVYNMVVPFSIGEPTNAKHTSYFYWMSCDFNELWRIYSNYSYDLPLWIDRTPVGSTASVVISNDTEVKHGGSASMKVTHSGSGVFGVGITSTYTLTNTTNTNTKTHTFNDTFKDISSYTKMGFYVRNSGTSSVTISDVKLENYSAAITVDGLNTAAIAADGAWHYVVVDLNALTQGGTSYNSSSLTSVDDITLLFSCANSGNIHLDDFELFR